MFHKHGYTAKNLTPQQRRTYKSWDSMKQRCNNPKDTSAKYYHDKGVVICERWKSFDNFLEDMGERPPGCSLERKESNGPYSKENCRWASSVEQANNKSNNVLITALGRTQTLAQWAKELRQSWSVFARRKHRGWSDEKTITTPVKQYNWTKFTPQRLSPDTTTTRKRKNTTCLN